MLRAIESELEHRKNELSDTTLSSIYLGGGTPSVLDEAELNHLFESINKHFDWTGYSEITLEANPDDLTTDYLKMLRNSPVNRLSIGIQARAEHQLQWMNRSHTSEQGLHAIEHALELGFHRMTIDWIYGLPGLSDQEWIDSLNWMESLEIPHFSAYALTVEERTALAHQIRKGKTEVPADEAVVRQFDILLDWAEGSAYHQYEISNFSFPGREAIHNSHYWTGIPYLGIGPSAHSFDGYQRHWNVANNAKYMISIENDQLPKETEPFRQIDRVNERIMTALRLRSGLKWSEFQKDFGNYEQELKQRVADHPNSEWWIWDEGAVKLSRQGMHYADRAAADLFFD